MEFDHNGMSEEFDVHDDIEEAEIIITDIRSVKSSQEKDADTIIRENIDKANAILERVVQKITDGENDEPRMIEVAGQLVNAVTTAASTILNNGQNYDGLQYKYEMLELKKKELESKTSLPRNQTNNVFVGDFESMKRMIQDAQNPKQIEDKNENKEDDRNSQ